MLFDSKKSRFQSPTISAPNLPDAMVYLNLMPLLGFGMFASESSDDDESSMSDDDSSDSEYDALFKKKKKKKKSPKDIDGFLMNPDVFECAQKIQKNVRELQELSNGYVRGVIDLIAKGKLVFSYK